MKRQQSFILEKTDYNERKRGRIWRVTSDLSGYVRILTSHPNSKIELPFVDGGDGGGGHLLPMGSYSGKNPKVKVRSFAPLHHI